MSKTWSHPLLRCDPSPLRMQNHCFSFPNHETWTKKHKHVQQSTGQIQGNPFHWRWQQFTKTVQTNMFQQQCNMFSLRLAALILYDSLHGESRICCLSHHWEMATVTDERHNNTVKQTITPKLTRKTCTPIHPGYRAKSLFWLKLKSHSNPSRIQSTFTKHKPNSGKTHMNAAFRKTIGLSKTQSKKTQLFSNTFAPFANASRDAGNPLHWQVNLESATRQLFSSHCGTLPWVWQLHNL